MDDFDKNLIADFIEDNWSAFTSKCEELGQDPEVILNNLKGG